MALALVATRRQRFQDFIAIVVHRESVPLKILVIRKLFFDLHCSS
jgi:hypothetical protein